MNNDRPEDMYQAASDQADLELRRIHREFERLSVRRAHVAQAVRVLTPKVCWEGHVLVANVSLTSRRAGLTVGTRLAVLQKLPRR